MGLFLHCSSSDLPHKKVARKKKETKSKVALNNRKGRNIEKRPAGIGDRNVYGHWEMDTVVSAQGTGKSCLLVLSERMTREEIVIKIKNKKSSSVVHALNMLERKSGSRKFREKFKTITVDNGVEFLDGEGIEKSRYTKGNRTTLYYCHPYSSYERGTNENINRMIRRFFPKGTNFDEVTTKQVSMVQDWINNYPRKILGCISANKYKECLQIAL
jgi:IS30 family transposase